MCRFAKRCENFYPDQNNKSNCLLLCQKNPLALAIALMPDRYVEREAQNKPVDKKVVTMEKELPKQPNRKQKLDDEYKEMVSATQELDNEVIEFEFDPEGDIASKLTEPSGNIEALIKRTESNRNSTVIDEEMSKAIDDNINDNNAPVVHPLDEINFEAVERTAVADQPDEPHNAEVYIKTRERGRPKMTEEEKEISRVKREEEKAILEKEKHEEALRRRAEMKKKVAEKRSKKSKKK